MRDVQPIMLDRDDPGGRGSSGAARAGRARLGALLVGLGLFGSVCCIGCWMWIGLGAALALLGAEIIALAGAIWVLSR